MRKNISKEKNIYMEYIKSVNKCETKDYNVSIIDTNGELLFVDTIKLTNNEIQNEYKTLRKIIDLCYLPKCCEIKIKNYYFTWNDIEPILISDFVTNKLNKKLMLCY